MLFVDVNTDLLLVSSLDAMPCVLENESMDVLALIFWHYCCNQLHDRLKTESFSLKGQ